MNCKFKLLIKFLCIMAVTSVVLQPIVLASTTYAPQLKPVISSNPSQALIKSREGLQEIMNAVHSDFVGKATSPTIRLRLKQVRQYISQIPESESEDKKHIKPIYLSYGRVIDHYLLAEKIIKYYTPKSQGGLGHARTYDSTFLHDKNLAFIGKFYEFTYIPFTYKDIEKVQDMYRKADSILVNIRGTHYSETKKLNDAYDKIIINGDINNIKAFEKSVISHNCKACYPNYSDKITKLKNGYREVNTYKEFESASNDSTAMLIHVMKPITIPSTHNKHKNGNIIIRKNASLTITGHIYIEKIISNYGIINFINNSDITTTGYISHLYNYGTTNFNGTHTINSYIRNYEVLNINGKVISTGLIDNVKTLNNNNTLINKNTLSNYNRFYNNGTLTNSHRLNNSGELYNRNLIHNEFHIYSEKYSYFPMPYKPIIYNTPKAKILNNGNINCTIQGTTL